MGRQSGGVVRKGEGAQNKVQCFVLSPKRAFQNQRGSRAWFSHPGRREEESEAADELGAWGRGRVPHGISAAP